MTNQQQLHKRRFHVWTAATAILVLAYIGTMFFLFQSDTRAVFEPPLLLPAMNTLFAGLLPIAVSIIALRSYFSSGLSSLLYMGCGMMIFGIGAILAGWLIGGQQGPNVNVTIYNVAALLGSIFHLVGVVRVLQDEIPATNPERIKRNALWAGAAIALLLLPLTLATYQGLTPAFFVQGSGPTLLRQSVLGTAAALFLASAVVLVTLFTTREKPFYFLYSVSLLMISLGLTAFFIQKSVGSPIGWLGRIGHYIAGIYAMTAVLVTFKDAKSQRFSLHSTVTGLFRNPGLNTDRSSQNLTRTFGVLAFLLLIYAITVTWVSWIDEKSDSVRGMTTVVELEAKAIDSYFAHLEIDLKVFGEDLAQTGTKIDLDQAYALLKRFHEKRNELLNITLVQPDGEILLTAKNPPGTIHLTLAKESSFIKFIGELNQGKVLGIGQPLIGLVSKVVIVPVRYAVKDRQGHLSYIISANLPQEYLQSFWREAPITDKAAIGLIGENGFLFSRYPVPNNLTPEEIYGRPRTGALINYLQEKGFPERGHVQGASSLDGPEFLNAFRRLQNYPVTLFIAMPMSEIRASWWKRVSGTYLALIFLLIGGIATYRYSINRQNVENNKLKRAEAERDALEAQLRESHKMEALGTLAGGIAHDFNNALAAIAGNSELARQDVGPDHIALESLEEINKAARRAKDLVQQILAFGRRQPLERKPTTLSLVVLESARLMRATLPAGVSLNVECKADTPAVLADAPQIKQLLLNLCANAIHAVEDQGRPGVVEVRLEVHAQDEARGDLQPGRYARLTVQDNGSGMAEATRARIFEPFFTTKPMGKGTGLGLSVVHGIVKSHEASIEVESTPGEGSAFHICFPAVDAPVAAATTAAVAATPANGQGKHILYVDDEEAIVFLMQRLLERQGYRVSTFTNPEKALAAVRADPAQFDLAVTDYNMPDMSGLEVATALRDIRADLPVVLASGYITEELRAKAPAAGIRELIYKPDTVEDLCEAVARIANAQGAKAISS